MKNLSEDFAKILLLFSILFLNRSSLYATELRTILEKTLAVKPGESLYVKGSGADVQIKTWTKEEAYVKILGDRRAKEKMEFYVERKSDGLNVIVKRKGSNWFNWFSGGISLRIEVTIPNKFNADINTSGGDIELAFLKGVIRLFTSGGDVSVANAKGPLEIKTFGGDIDIYNQTGSSEVGASGGDIKIAGLRGNLFARTSGGDIHVNAIDGKIDVSTSGGDIFLDYSGSSYGIETSTSGGDIDLRLPADFKADAELNSTGGDVNVDFDNAKIFKVTRTKFEAELNGGGERLYCRTSGGEISLRQK